MSNPWSCIALAVFLGGTAGFRSTAAAEDWPYRAVVLSDEFWAEGGTFADLNRDGEADAVAGPFWYEGPDFTRRHQLYEPAPEPFDPLKYSDNFFAFAHDFDGDTWLDVLVIGFPGRQATWLRNPGEAGGGWQRYLVLDGVDNESPTFGDLFGDGRPVLICMTGARFGYAAPDPQDPTKPWTFHAVTPPNPWNAYTHGLGFGDVNGDGRNDLLEGGGWWEQPASRSPDQLWVKHAFDFGRGAQMLVADVNGDGRNDIISSRDAHGYGLAWYEQIPAEANPGDLTFRRHDILPDSAEAPEGELQFSQLHALVLADVDGDGLEDIVTGKRWWAHGPTGDPDPNGTPVVYAFLLRRSAEGTVSFQPHPIHDASGVGTQITAADLNRDGRADLLSVNKRGTHVLLSQ